jgi:hypothetical protein
MQVRIYGLPACFVSLFLPLDKLAEEFEVFDVLHDSRQGSLGIAC